jgi:hypothetical protein
MVNQFLLAVVSAVAIAVPSAAQSVEVTRTCQGNIETGSRQIVQAGVQYKLSYEVSGSTAKVRFAGREFDANVETGRSWAGPWFKRMDDEIYFSYLPEEGGTIKFQFSLDRWYSGNC